MKRRESRKTQQTRTIYFVHSPDTRMVKIGVANDAIDRLKTMQTGSPVPLEIAGVMTCDRGGALERELHKRFGHLRVRGEWFREDPELMDFIKHNGERDSAMPPALQAELICNMLLVGDDDPPRVHASKLALTFYPCHEMGETLKALNATDWAGAPDDEDVSSEELVWELLAYACQRADAAFPTFKDVAPNLPA